LNACGKQSACGNYGRVVLVIDDTAASQLSDVDFYKHIEVENQKQLERLGRA